MIPSDELPHPCIFRLHFKPKKGKHFGNAPQFGKHICKWNVATRLFILYLKGDGKVCETIPPTPSQSSASTASMASRSDFAIEDNNKESK